MERLHRFSIDAIAPTPWKNGGGTTRELVSKPTDAGSDFDWRVSIATIDAAGPFSPFPGVDRTIMLLAGDGVRLTVSGMVDHLLNRPFVPFSFSGDWTLQCVPLGGSSTDFNVMTRREKFESEVYVVSETCDIAPAAHGMLLAVSGTWAISNDETSVPIEARVGGWWQNAPYAWRATPQDDGAKLIVVRILERRTP